MAWLRIDDGFAEHQKIAPLSDRAFRLHVAALCYIARNLTDGRINPRAFSVISAIVGTKSTRYPQELCDAEVWREHPDGGYEITAYLEWNPSANKVKAARKRGAERQAEHRDRNGVRNALRNGVSHALHVTVPHPLSTKSSKPRAVISSHYESTVNGNGALEEETA